MTFVDLGDPWPDLAITVRNASGTAENAGSVVLTVELPDGSTTTPTVNNDGTGLYSAAYLPAIEGHYRARWVATGTNASAYEQSIDVARWAGIISLAEAKAELNKAPGVTLDDEELRSKVLAASQWVEERVGPVVRRTITAERVNPQGGRLWLQGPVISLTSITAVTGYPGGPYDVSQVDLDAERGVVNPRYAGMPFSWPVLVTYVAGRTSVHEDIRDATKTYLRALWASQTGGTATSAVALAQGDFGEVPAASYFLLRKEAERQLEDHMAPVVA